MADWDAPEAPYRQIYESLRERIETEQLKPGDRLPSARALMDEFAAASHTVQRAIRALRDAQLVKSIPNRGVYVRERPLTVERSATYTKAPEPGEPSRYGAKSKLIALEPVPAPAYIAERLGIERGTEVLLRRRLMERDGTPVEIVASYYPMEIAAGTELSSEAPLKGGSPAALERLGYPAERTTEWVFARLPLQAEVSLLRIAPTTPMLRLLRTVFAEDGRPVEAIEMVMDGERNVLRYDL